MTRGSDTRFRKGHSGNPGGRPKVRRPHVSAFDVVFDKVLTVTQGGRERELTVDEALQFQTYQEALKGNRTAIRLVLKMIEKREAALARLHKPQPNPVTTRFEFDAVNADEAMRLLGIVEPDPLWGDEHPRMKVATWAVQAALSRPGRRKFTEKQVENIKLFTTEAGKLRWPRGRVA